MNESINDILIQVEDVASVLQALEEENKACEHVMLFFREWQLECCLHHLPANVAKHVKHHMKKHHFTRVCRRGWGEPRVRHQDPKGLAA